MELILIRHAETTGQAPDAPLTEAGMAQAEALVSVLSQLAPTALFSSPYRRAQATLEPFASISGQSIQLLDDLRERLLSPGPLPDHRAHLERSFEDPDHAPDGGESHRTLLARVRGALSVCAQRGGERPAVATHGGVTACLLNSIDPSFGYAEMKTLGNPDLFRIPFEAGAPISYTRITP